MRLPRVSGRVSCRTSGSPWSASSAGQAQQTSEVRASATAGRPAALSDPEQGPSLSAYGAYGEKKLYGKVVTGVIRSTFVISPTGEIEHAFHNVKATGHVAKLIRDLGLES